MIDSRAKEFARVLVDHSISVQKGDNVLISMRDHDTELCCALIKAIYERGGKPFVELTSTRLNSVLYKGFSEEMVKAMAEFDARRFAEMQCYISFAKPLNSFDMIDVPQEKVRLYRTHHAKVMDEIMHKNNIRWVMVEYPGPGAAQKAEMSTEAFEDFFFSACCVDYSTLSRSMDVLKALMEKTDRVHIKGPGTDISFSIKDIPVMKCDGIYNVPDGEVFTAPVRDSVNGTVTFNADSIKSGYRFSNITLTFENGKCVKATANNTERLNEILDTDEGARYIGEFAFGVNSAIKRPMLSTLFDEKINGSFHFAMGDAYEYTPNGNKSAIHWDLINIQTPEWGGGEIWFDGVLIRKDGLFIPEELQGLNPAE
ncbi:MAG: aminopeptidase [Clostridiales bacterium]|nr:aminopeptidase [Clostridiales bacterium]